MFENPLSFTYQDLSSLKFKELQKLSVQFHVNKRWAKKQELIEKLLALKDNSPYNKDGVPNQKEEKEWTDGGLVFGSRNGNEGKENNSDRRLTFNINKGSNSDSGGKRLTYEISQNEKNLISADSEVINTRETYDIAPSSKDLNLEYLIESRATFDVPQNGKILLQETERESPDIFKTENLNSNDTFEIHQNTEPNENEQDTNSPFACNNSRATFDIPQNGKKLLEKSVVESLENSHMKIKKEVQHNLKNKINLVENSGIKQNSEKKLIFDISLKSDKKEIKGKTQIKMLTIPYESIQKRTKKEGDTDKNSMKLSKKSINIKKIPKPSASKIELLKSPKPSSIQKSVSNQILIQSLTKPHRSVLNNEPPTKLQSGLKKQTNTEKALKDNETNKENVRNLRRRKSKTEDNVLTKKAETAKVSFMSPPASLRNNHRHSKPLKKTPYKGDTEVKTTPTILNQMASRIPKIKSNTVTTKPITLTKMPDFAKIHQRQFEQMDSLHDYVRKKEERAKKLFGTPQPGAQSKVANKPGTLFQFQSSNSDKSQPKFGKSTDNIMKLIKKKETNIQKDAVKNKLPPSKIQTDIKDKNRSHIHGVRTNKRFELQMKFRNMI